MNSIQDNNMRITSKTSEKPINHNNRISDGIIAYSHNHTKGDKTPKRKNTEKEKGKKNKIMKIQ